MQSDKAWRFVFSAIYLLVLFMIIIAPAVVYAGHFPSPIITDRSSDFIGTININGRAAQPGDEVAFFCPHGSITQGVVCGLYVVTQPGEYGIVSVYGDDPTTVIDDEGAQEGGTLTVRIWYAKAGVELEGEAIALSGGEQAGSFLTSSSPPVWRERAGYVLNIEAMTHFSDPSSTPSGSNYFGNLTLMGNPADIGDEVAVFDPDGVLAGHFVVTIPGKYGIMQVYGDDTTTPSTDEGAQSGDKLSFKVWSKSLGIEYSGNKLILSPDSPIGSFITSAKPPVWTENTGYVLNLEVTDDSTAPETIIDTMPEKLDNSRAAIFSFLSTEVDSTFECRMDNASYEPCPSTREYHGLTEGSHTFSVRASDRAGNPDSTPASYTWTIDISPPSSNITSPINGIRIISSTFTIQGTATDTISQIEKVEVSVDGGTTWNLASGTTSWTYEWAIHEDGEYSIKSRVTDAAGNVEASLQSLQVAVYKKPPVKGDINNDGGVTLTDVVLVLQVLAGLKPAAVREDYVASGVDVDLDKKIGLAEAIFALQIVAGLRSILSDTTDTTPPTVPTGLTAVALSTSRIDLSWIASTDDEGVAGYKIFGMEGAFLKSVSGTSASDTGLNANTQYCYSVSSYDAAGNESGQSNQVCATTMSPTDTAPPSVPTDLTATVVSAGQISLSWTVSTDNVGVTGYKVYKGGTYLKSVTETSASDAGLNANTRYCYTVSAYDAVGSESGQSIQACATTQSTATGLLQDSFDYTGPYPDPTSITFSENETLTTVMAYPGQIMVMLTTTTSLADATGPIITNGGTILSQYPALGYYLVGVMPGAESTFISSIATDSRVYQAVPHLTAANRGTTIIESDCSGSHAEVVKEQRELYAGTPGNAECKTAGDGSGIRATMANVVNFTIKAVAANGGQTTFINQSIGPELGFDYTIIASTTDRANALSDWRWGTRLALASLAQMPEAYRENLVVTIAAGNSNIPLCDQLANIRTDPKIASILRNNVVLVTTNVKVPLGSPFQPPEYPTGDFANNCPNDPDVVVMSNPKSGDGTSFAAPALLGAIEKNIEELKLITGANTALAMKAIKLAVNTNANHELVLSEARDKIKVTREAETNDSSGSYNVTGIRITATGENTTAVITPAISGVTVQYSVSGTDGYYDSGSLQTDSSGHVSFSIPPGESGVVDTISVTAALSGRYSSRGHTW